MPKRKFSKGAALVEFALCFVVFIMLVLFVLDFGRYMLIQHNLNLVAAEAARAGITGTRLDRNTGSGSVTTLNREQSIRVAAIEMAGKLPLVNLGTVNPYNPQNITVEFSTSENSYTSQDLSSLTWSAGAGGYDALVRVTVTQQFTWLTPALRWIGATTNLNTIRAYSVQRNRGDEDEFTDP